MGQYTLNEKAKVSNERFETLANEQVKAKSTLLDETITDLLKEYEAKAQNPYINKIDRTK